MSEPSKQDIAAIFKRLRSISTNKVRTLNNKRVFLLTRKLVELELWHVAPRLAKLIFNVTEDFKNVLLVLLTVMWLCLAKSCFLTTFAKSKT